MLREFFNEKLTEFEKEVLNMGEMVIRAIQRSVEALKTLDQEEAQKIIANDIFTHGLRRKSFQVLGMIILP
ncbi:MAG: hypothetical protein DDT22_01059 [candidate division WS2 bacterium]|nr:hypothetical protein [Candidatus Lithacetigena glycinireducens]